MTQLLDETSDDPRVARTRDAVFTVVRAILIEEGPGALTFSAISKRSGITRQTLYRHWPTLQSLYVDLVVSSHEDLYPDAVGDPRAIVFDFLVTLRVGIREPVLKAAILALSAEADRDDESAAALNTIIESRRGTLNGLLASAGLQVDEEQFAGLCGPVFFERLIRNQEAGDDLIARTIDVWLDLPDRIQR